MGWRSVAFSGPEKPDRGASVRGRAHPARVGRLPTADLELELCLSRAKPEETLVEARSGSEIIGAED